MHGLLRVPLAGGLLIIVLAAAGPASAQPLQGQPAQTVLVIFSGPESHPSNLALDESIRHALAAPPEIRIDYFAEYLDTDPVPPDQSARELAEFLAMKFQGRRIDVVVAITDAALRFVLDQRQRLFPAVPILFMGLHVPDEIARSPDRPLTGVLVGVAYAETLEAALSLHPATEQVLVVAKTDSAVSLATVERNLARFAGRVTLRYVREPTIERLLGVVRGAPPRSLILYLWHQPDETSNFVFPDTVARQVASVSPVPVYGTSDFYVGLGVVGGVVRLTRETGQRLGQMARQLLAGVPPRDIPLESARLVPIFDWGQLRRWGIDQAKLPPGADVRFRVPTVWESYHAYIVGTLLLMMAQLVLIAGLLAQRARRRRAEASVRASEASLRQSYRRTRLLAARLINAQEAARAGIARDLHDDVCQQLAFVAISVSTLKQSPAGIQDAESQQGFSDLEHRTQAMFDGIRRLSHDLHPASLRLLGLAPALRTHCVEVTKRHNVSIAVEAGVDLGVIHPDVAVCLFRIAQESIRNAVEHGGSQRITVKVVRIGPTVELEVADDGRGFDLDRVRAQGGGLGLVSMEERAHAIGGEATFTSAPRRGTTVRVRCPADPSPASPDGRQPARMSPEVSGYLG